MKDSFNEKILKNTKIENLKEMNLLKSFNDDTSNLNPNKNDENKSKYVQNFNTNKTVRIYPNHHELQDKTVEKLDLDQLKIEYHQTFL